MRGREGGSFKSFFIDKLRWQDVSKVNNGDNWIGIDPNKLVVFKILNQIGTDSIWNFGDRN